VKKHPAIEQTAQQVVHSSILRQLINSVLLKL